MYTRRKITAIIEGKLKLSKLHESKELNFPIDNEF